MTKRGSRKGNPIPGDTAEYVAQKILEGIETGDAEIFAHDWMKKMKERVHKTRL